MRNETLKRKIETNIINLKAKIEPYQDELLLQEGLLAQLTAHESKSVAAAQETLGI